MKGQSILISILMPAYNCEKYVTQAIDSILNQTYTNWELLTADDSSKDNTRKIIDNYSDPRIKRFHNKSNIGYLKTWNKLIAESKGNYITFLDADDTSELNRLELLIKTFISSPDEIGAIGSNYNRIDDKNNIVFTSDFKLTNEEIVAQMPKKFDILGSGIMIKREVYESIGGYHTFFDRIGAEDYYWIYLISEKYKIINIADVLYNYRFNPNSVMGNLSLNPQKLFIIDVIKKVIEQRKENGNDDISNNNLNGITYFLESKLNTIGKEKHQLLHYISKRRFYEGHKKLAINTLIKAIFNKPFNIDLYKDLYYFIKN
jgi:glycosyltransferase involved in cell wall biosynthesis